MNKFFQTLTLVVIAGIFFVFGSAITRPDDDSLTERTITVSGYGAGATAPDSAEVTVGVQTGRQPTSQAAMSTLNDKIKAITDALEAINIEKKHITTNSLWLNPAYDYVDGVQRESGFEATQNIKITVVNVADVSRIVDASVEAGANQVQNVQFIVSKENTVKNTARTTAIKDAKANAEQLAQELNVRLGKIISFSETTNGSVNPPYPMFDRGQGGGGAESVIPEGEKNVESQVTITYEIK